MTSESGTVSAEECYIREGDNIVVRQSWLNKWGLLVATALSTAVLLYVTLFYPEWSTLHSDSDGSRAFNFPYLVFVPLFLLAFTAHRVADIKLVLCPDYLILVEGTLAWRERSVRLDYRNIQEIEIDQTIPQRIFGIGDVKIVPIASAAESTIRMPGIKVPRALKDLLRTRADAAPRRDYANG